MRLAGILTRSLGFPLDDAAAMVEIVVSDVLVRCEQNDVEPVGSLMMKMINTVPHLDDDVGVRWEFDPSGWGTTAASRP